MSSSSSWNGWSQPQPRYTWVDPGGNTWTHPTRWERPRGWHDRELSTDVLGSPSWYLGADPPHHNNSSSLDCMLMWFGRNSGPWTDPRWRTLLLFIFLQERFGWAPIRAVARRFAFVGFHYCKDVRCTFKFAAASPLRRLPWWHEDRIDNWMELHSLCRTCYQRTVQHPPEHNTHLTVWCLRCRKHVADWNYHEHERWCCRDLDRDNNFDDNDFL
jgi:hypothetical protein